MTALAAAPPPVEITPRAAADIRWLEKTLRRQYQGWLQEGDGSFRVTLLRSTGKEQWHYGATLEQAAARARAEVELVLGRGRP